MLIEDEVDEAPGAATPAEVDPEKNPARVLAHVNKVIQTIKDDKAHHEKPFKQMKTDMFMAMKGRSEDWSESNYKANFLGRHVKTKTASLYAKNPKAVATRAERLDFQIWDESPESLTMAFQLTQMAVALQQEAASQPPMIDPLTGAPQQAVAQLPPGFQEAQALIADYQQGMTYRQNIDKIGKTLEILFARALRDQEPVDFKTAAKQMVRRACTTGVGYVELGFIRQTGERPGLNDQLADARARLGHIRRLIEETEEGEITADDPELAELEASIAALQNEPEIVLREGLTFDFPASTNVIPDKLCKSLVGFIGARHLTIEYLFTPEEVEEMFPGVDLRLGYQEYGPDGNSLKQPAQVEMSFGGDVVEDMDDAVSETPSTNRRGLMRVWKHYDKPSGLVYYVADGYKGWLREPAPPDVFVEKFWPVFALTFNAVESEDALFPPSDVYLLADQQNEHNRSRQGMREHREAARPRWATRKGLLDDNDKNALKTAQPFDVIEVNTDAPIGEILESLPVPGVDPNLYETGQFFSDVQIVGGGQESTYGGVAKATATESAIAANSTASSDGSSTDDLDAFLTMVARASSQILLNEMSTEQVMQICGPGAVWPEMTLSEIASELALEVEAGSSGRPNQAVEIDNFTKMAPFLMQIPGISPTWMAQEAVRRMDDRIDLAKAVSANVPSIMAMNSMKQIGTGTPSQDPNQQGPEGANNAPSPEAERAGSDAAFGSNQVGGVFG